jgi:hypothetical protein
VARLFWDAERDYGGRGVGPVRRVFDDVRGLVVDGSSRWSLDMQPHHSRRGLHRQENDPRRHDLVNVRWVTPLGVETASMS